VPRNISNNLHQPPRCPSRVAVGGVGDRPANSVRQDTWQGDDPSVCAMMRGQAARRDDKRPAFSPSTTPCPFGYNNIVNSATGE